MVILNLPLFFHNTSAGDVAQAIQDMSSKRTHFLGHQLLSHPIPNPHRNSSGKHLRGISTFTRYEYDKDIRDRLGAEIHILSSTSYPSCVWFSIWLELVSITVYMQMGRGHARISYYKLHIRRMVERVGGSQRAEARPLILNSRCNVHVHATYNLSDGDLIYLSVANMPLLTEDPHEILSLGLIIEGFFGGFATYTGIVHAFVARVLVVLTYLDEYLGFVRPGSHILPNLLPCGKLPTEKMKTRTEIMALSSQPPELLDIMASFVPPSHRSSLWLSHARLSTPSPSRTTSSSGSFDNYCFFRWIHDVKTVFTAVVRSCPNLRELEIDFYDNAPRLRFDSISNQSLGLRGPGRLLENIGKCVRNASQMPTAEALRIASVRRDVRKKICRHSLDTSAAIVSNADIDTILDTLLRALAAAPRLQYFGVDVIYTDCFRPMPRWFTRDTQGVCGDDRGTGFEEVYGSGYQPKSKNRGNHKRISWAVILLRAWPFNGIKPGSGG
ncbi:hypothetical protein C8R44DRAFT_747006 [Mycena epipterygia]|nr:hypothetical protein C8R44DRAFT_747006 [Mycena epipterygia]